MIKAFFPILFNTESNPIRFAKVCIDLYSEAEGITLVPTSRSWDQGRDARSISVRQRSSLIKYVMCATLNVTLDSKISEDIKRLSSTTD